MKIAIIGLGYVGLPLAHAFSFKYKVVGFDIAQWRINELKNGIDRTLELSDKQVKEAIENSMQFTNDLNSIADCNVYIVTVPTPIDKNKRPDLSPFLRRAILLFMNLQYIQGLQKKNVYRFLNNSQV